MQSHKFKKWLTTLLLLDLPNARLIHFHVANIESSCIVAFRLRLLAFVSQVFVGLNCIRLILKIHGWPRIL